MWFIFFEDIHHNCYLSSPRETLSEMLCSVGKLNDFIHFISEPFYVCDKNVAELLVLLSENQRS